MSEDINEDAIIESLYEDLMKEYELDPTMTLDDILYEMFAHGFEAALSLSEEEDEQEAE